MAASLQLAGVGIRVMQVANLPHRQPQVTLALNLRHVQAQSHLRCANRYIEGKKFFFIRFSLYCAVMTYAETLPLPVLKLCRWFNAGCFLICVLVCIDIFILPRLVYKEKIVSRQEMYTTTRNRFSGQSHKRQLDSVILTTKNFRFLYHKAQGFDPTKADSVRFVSTLLFRMVERGYMKRHGEEQELKHGASMFGTSMFIPISIAFIAIFGIAMRHNKEQLLNAAMMNIILIIIQLWLLGYFYSIAN
ncbi:hypothetical protein ACFS7Z_13550 [Pontibacter toksunensis]|uniref:Uncharacterized protein n=1 Tax=Pontibacter toksunensis TaxID=1332631 RepID=A0ABW6BWE3_9BACT